MNNDLISREALKEAISTCDKFACLPDTRLMPFYKLVDAEKNYVPYVHFEDIVKAIDNAPTVDYPFYAEAYQTGFEEAKEKIIHSIAEQYTAHNELVPMWLSIGDIKGGAE